MEERTDGFVVADDATLVRLVESASRRLVVVAPAVTTVVARAVAAAWRRLGAERVAVILDVDAEPYHAGYGEPEGLRLLLQAADDAGGAVRQQRGVRIGLLVADDATLVFSPTPLSIEEPPAGPDASPNGVLLGAPPPAVEAQVAADEGALGARPADPFSVRRLQTELKRNPPRKFEITRVERAFNARFEFVELELRGAALGRHLGRVPAHLAPALSSSQVGKRLEARVRLFDGDKGLAANGLLGEKKKLVDKFLVVLPRYGTAILRENKGAFLEEVGALQKKVEAFRTQAVAALEAGIDARVGELVDALLPGVLENPPAPWRRYGDVRGFTEERTRALLEEDIRDEWERPEAVAEGIALEVRFKGVTYESLADPRFADVARERLRIEKLHDEHRVVRASAPASETWTEEG